MVLFVRSLLHFKPHAPNILKGPPIPVCYELSFNRPIRPFGETEQGQPRARAGVQAPYSCPGLESKAPIPAPVVVPAPALGSVSSPKKQQLHTDSCISSGGDWVSESSVVGGKQMSGSLFNLN